MSAKAKRVLVLSPHIDDGEFGCGGTVARLAREGYEVFYAAFSTAEASVPPGYPPNILEVEVREATRHLGIECGALARGEDQPAPTAQFRRAQHPA